MDTSLFNRVEPRRRLASAVAAALGGSALALLAGATPAFAAEVEASATSGSVLEEIVVTAQFREEKLQETPIAITAITAQDIQERSFSDSYEIGYTVPNASFRPAQAAFGNTMTAFIRGVGQNDFDQAFEPGVGIYVDDVYQPYTLGTQMDLLDMERVEVLRGPQGTLFGRGSIGGVMRLVSKQPEGSDTGFVDLDDRLVQSGRCPRRLRLQRLRTMCSPVSRACPSKARAIRRSSISRACTRVIRR